jgi:hypothetical protein
MADCLADLILRPHADRAAVQVALTLVAGVDTVTGRGDGSDEPGEFGGDLVSAAQARELAYTFGLMPRPAADTDQAPEAHADDEAGHREPEPTGRSAPTEQESDVRLDALRAVELAAAEELLAASATGRRPSLAGTDTPAAQAALTRLLDARRLIDSALAERPRIAVADRLSGTLLALTDSTELRAAAASGRGLGPPPGTDAYRPTDGLYRFVRLRDRRCRFPGCRIRARCCDLDHQVPHPHGPTAHDNLACLCEHHHRLSHQAPGWRLHRDPDGGLVWTLPGGRTVTTCPPAFGSDDGSTPAPLPASRPGRQRYRDALAAIRDAGPIPRTADIPF